MSELQSHNEAGNWRRPSLSTSLPTNPPELTPGGGSFWARNKTRGSGLVPWALCICALALTRGATLHFLIQGSESSLLLSRWSGIS